jgi:Kef-type K+ transport system membrane component KefB
MDHGVIHDLAICIVAAWLLAVLAQLFRQPLILAYLVAGFVIGPICLALVKSEESIATLSNVGLILLLFLIGLEIDLKKILGAGKLITVTAATQILGGCCLGILFFWAVGFPLGDGAFDALYLGVGVALSSTVIIVKVLYEKRELDTLPGRVTLGILVLQDLFAILFLALQPNLEKAGPVVLAVSVLKIALLIGVAFAVSRYALPAIFQSVARLPELVLVGALGWCFLIAGLAGALQLSHEMGALVAGVAISTFPYALDVAAKVTSLRDFFVTLFFVALGMEIPLPTTSGLLWALSIAGFVIASRMASVFPTLHLMGQGFRASLIPAINLAQISELSLVILTLGIGLHHISPQTQGVMTYAFVLLAVASTYGIFKNNDIQLALGPFLRRLGLRDVGEETVFLTASPAKPKIYLLGFSWTASSLLEELSRHAPNLLPELAVIDFNPVVNAELRARGIHVIYGDISQRDTLHHAGIGEAEVIVCSLPNTVLKGTNNLKMLRQLRELNAEAKIVMHAELFGDIPKLYELGADYVSVPRLIEAQDLSVVIQAARRGLLKEKRAALDLELEGRKEVIP